MNENYDINQNKTFSANNLDSKSRYVEIKKHFYQKNAFLSHYLLLIGEISNCLPYHQTPRGYSLLARLILLRNKKNIFHLFSTASKNLHTF